MKRIQSIDVLRGVTILVMLFVNDLAGVADVPAWLKHYDQPGADGMTFVDLVFPAFLFIVGMSIPFAFEKRLSRSSSTLPVWRHLIFRTFSLLVLGFYMVNSNHLSDGGLLSRRVWTLLFYVCVFLIWSETNKQNKRYRTLFGQLKKAGVAGLIILAILFRGRGEAAFFEMRPYYWGILGLIGWAYLTAGTTFLFTRRNTTALLGVMTVLSCFYLADMAAGPFLPWLHPWLKAGYVLCPHSVIVLGGTVLSINITDSSIKTAPRAQIGWAFFYGFVFLIAGVLLHRLNTIHPAFAMYKNTATIPWCFVSCGLVAWLWAGVFWLVDVAGITSWTRIFEPAGRNPLFVYLLAPLVYIIIEYIGLIFGTPRFFYRIGEQFPAGLARSLFITALLPFLTAMLSKRGVRVKV